MIYILPTYIEKVKIITYVLCWNVQFYTWKYFMFNQVQLGKYLLTCEDGETCLLINAEPDITNYREDCKLPSHNMSFRFRKLITDGKVIPHDTKMDVIEDIDIELIEKG